MEKIELNWGEAWRAAEIGCMRQLEAMKKGLPDKYGYEGDGWSIHIDGAGGEIAVAKVLNLYWGGSVNTFKTQGDVGKLEVRTRSRDDYDLLIRPDDHNDSCYILVTGKLPSYKVHGWMNGKDAKQSKWMKDYGGKTGAYFVPKSELRDLFLIKGK